MAAELPTAYQASAVEAIEQRRGIMNTPTMGLISFLLLTIASAGQAIDHVSVVDKRKSADYKTCMASGDAASGVTSGILDCNGSEIDRQDAKLNQAYKMVMARLPQAKKMDLRSSERLWIVDRDRRCSRKQEEVGGTLGSIVYSSCILDETIKRTIWLELHQP